MLKSENMRIEEKNGVVFLKFKALDKVDFINQAVSTRIGGVSTKGNLKSLNLGMHTDDEKENVIKNYELFGAAAGFTTKNFVTSRQTHGTNIRMVTNADKGKGVYTERDYDSVDGLITDEKNIPIAIHTADCVPVTIIDRKNKAVGSAHCGWRGTFAQLSRLLAQKMAKTYGTQLKDCICVIGPAICKNCYEVSKDLFEQFSEKFNYEDAIFTEDEKFFLDLPLINKHILDELGIKDITISDICTCCYKEEMFSHRGLGKDRGILASVTEIIK